MEVRREHRKDRIENHGYHRRNAWRHQLPDVIEKANDQRPKRARLEERIICHRVAETSFRFSTFEVGKVRFQRGSLGEGL